jgi:peroxiredoxin
MTGAYNLSELPESIPTPVDYGAYEHLPGMRLPPVALPSTSGDPMDLSGLPGITIVYGYLRTRRPDENLPRGWDEISGARGCMLQSCAFRDRHAELQRLDARVFGLSTQDTGYQREAVERLHLPFELLSDKSLTFAKALGIPTFEVKRMALIKRLTLVIYDGWIERVFYPVFPSDENASKVIERLSGRAV